jgi:hypothetical protein
MMIARAHLIFDRGYYNQYYDDWLEVRSRFRKFATLLGVLFFLLAMTTLLFLKDFEVLGGALLALGFVSLGESLTYRSRWINGRLKAGATETAELEFYDDKIRMRSDSSEGHYLLSGFVERIPTENGIFLVPQKGISFYVPWASIEPQDAMSSIRDLLLKETEQDSGGDVVAHAPQN